MNVYDKINSLCASRQIGIYQIGDIIPGLSVSKNAIIRWRHGSVPRMDKLFLIAEYFGVPIEYFTENNGPDTTEEEALLLSYFRAMSIVQRAKLIVYAENLHRNG